MSGSILTYFADKRLTGQAASNSPTTMTIAQGSGATGAEGRLAATIKEQEVEIDRVKKENGELRQKNATWEGSKIQLKELKKEVLRLREENETFHIKYLQDKVVYTLDSLEEDMDAIDEKVIKARGLIKRIYGS